MVVVSIMLNFGSEGRSEVVFCEFWVESVRFS